MAQSNNPAFRNTPAFKENPTAEQLQALYDLPSANRAPEATMTVESTVLKSVLSFGVLVIGAVIGWVLTASNPAVGWPVVGVAAIAAFVLSLVNIFKKEPSAPLILAYALLEGIAVGAISMIYNSQWDGIVMQAVIATFVVVGVTLALFASGKIRASARATKIWLIAMVGYFVFSIVNMILMFTGVNKNPWGLGGTTVFGIPLGVIIGILVVFMAAYSLVLDFDMVQRGVANKAPASFAWTGAFSILITVVWLYLEILRILAIARR